MVRGGRAFKNLNKSERKDRWSN